MQSYVKLVVAGVVVIAVAAGGGWLLIGRQQDNTAQQTTANSQTSASQTTQPADQGQYVDYTPEAIANTKGTKILFFHAAWCPQCRALEDSIKAGNIPDGTTIIKVDYDSNQQLRQKYGVTIQTTLVKVDDNGDLIESYVAYDEPTLDALIRNLL